MAVQQRRRNPRYKGAYRGVKKSHTLSRKVRRSAGTAKAVHYMRRHYARKKARAMGADMRVNRGFKRRIRRARKLGSSTARQTTYYLKSHLARKRRRNRGYKHKLRRAQKRGEPYSAQIARYQRRHHGRLSRRAWPTRGYYTKNRGRRRNPGLALTGNTAAVVGILGGAAVTKIITGFLPSTLTSGFTGMLTTGVVAMVAGNVTGRMTKNRSLGNWMTVGGLLIVGLQLAGQLFPQLQLPFGLSTSTSGTSTSGTAGLGLISSSNFYVPQVNLPGSMASFVTPAGIPAPVVVQAPAKTNGLGLISSSNFYVPQVNLPGSMASFVTPAGIPAPIIVPAPSMHGLGAAMTQKVRLEHPHERYRRHPMPAQRHG